MWTNKGYLLISITLFCWVLGFNKIKAQQQHYSIFNQTAYFLNPAETGNFEANYRGVLLGKRQWNSVTEPYQGFVGGIDFKTPFSNLPFSFGLLFADDVAGDSRFKNTFVKALANYHLNYKDFSINLGLSAGYDQLSFDQSALRFGSQFINGQFISEADPNENFLQNSSGFFSAGVGLLAQYKVRENNLYFGLSSQRINRPNPDLFIQNNIQNQRLNLYSGYRFFINDMLAINPTLLFSTQGAASETVFLTEMNLYRQKSDIFSQYIIATAGLRLNDAVFLGGGFGSTHSKIIIAYDVNTSALNNSSQYQGGWEVILHYQIRHPKTIEKGKINCPEYF
jgi:type IX secretion system PorP/SprF family membrane protein